jgi:hypothetical protein
MSTYTRQTLKIQTVTLKTLERVAGIEPASLAWKAKVLPLNYTRFILTLPTYLAHQVDSLYGGGGWIRTTEAYASDLQSDPFGHSGTPPKGGTLS